MFYLLFNIILKNKNLSSLYLGVSCGINSVKSLKSAGNVSTGTIAYGVNLLLSFTREQLGHENVIFILVSVFFDQGKAYFPVVCF